MAFNGAPRPHRSHPRFPDTEERIAALEAALEERILVLDGATGTALQAVNLTAADFGGPDLEGCNEMLCVTRPDVVAGVHERYLRAGADIVETNTFGATSIVLAEYDVADRAFELNQRAARIARETCARFDTPGRLRFVCGSMGPTTKAISVTGGVTFEELRAVLRRAGARPDGRRRRLPAARDLPGHAQRQGRAARHRATPSRRPAGTCRSRCR